MQLGASDVQRLEAEVVRLEQFTGSKAFMGNPLIETSYAPALLPAKQQQLQQARQQQQQQQKEDEVSTTWTAWAMPELLVPATGHACHVQSVFPHMDHMHAD
jgi:hypothetical protein